SARLSYPSLFLHDTAPPSLYTLSLHDALPIFSPTCRPDRSGSRCRPAPAKGSRSSRVSAATFSPRSGSTATAACSAATSATRPRSEEHTSELQSPDHLVCRLLLEKKKKIQSSI